MRFRTKTTKATSAIPRRFFWIAAGSGLPVDQAVLPIEFSDCIEIGNKLMVSDKVSRHFDLQMILRTMNAKPILSCKAFEQANPLMQQAVPRLAVLVLQGRLAEGGPFFEESGTAVLMREIGAKGVFKRPAKQSGRPGLLFLPSVEITIPIAARAAHIPADLAVAKDHGLAPVGPSVGATGDDRVAHSFAGAKPSRF